MARIKRRGNASPKALDRTQGITQGRPPKIVLWRNGRGSRPENLAALVLSLRFRSCLTTQRDVEGQSPQAFVLVPERSPICGRAQRIVEGGFTLVGMAPGTYGDVPMSRVRSAAALMSISPLRGRASIDHRAVMNDNAICVSIFRLFDLSAGERMTDKAGHLATLL